MTRSTSLKATLIIAVLAFGGLLFVSFAAVSSYWVSRDLREQFHRRGEVLLDTMATEAVQSLAIDDETERRLSLLLLTHRATIGDVAYAQVVSGGRVVSESFQTNSISLDTLDNLPLQPRAQQIDGGESKYLDFIRPLPNSEPGSYIRLGMNLESIQHRVRQTVQLMGVLSVLFTALGVVGAFGLYSIILKPLDRLMASISRISQGEYHVRAGVQGSSEFQEISKAFNRMADEITLRAKTLNEKNQQLEKANQAKSEFLAMIGHELKTPLHTILGNCQLLLDGAVGPLTSEQKSDLQVVLAAGNHLLSLIQNILQFNASGVDPVHGVPVSMNALLEHAVEYVRPFAHEKNLPVVVRANDIDEEIVVDETKIKQVLINLLHNAVKYTDEGQVQVHAWSHENGVYITVKDTGPGIPKTEQRRVFEPFVRIGRGERRTIPGMGLGLAVVSRYVQAHGGWVRLESHEGHGSIFTIFLPKGQLEPLEQPITIQRGASA